MKKQDYKFWYIKRENGGHIIEATVRFYEGDYKMVDVPDPNDMDKTVKENRYVRDKKLTKADLPFLADQPVKKNTHGEDEFVFTPADFGWIKEDDELRAWLNKEMKKDTTRDNIPEQVEEDVEKLKNLNKK